MKKKKKNVVTDEKKVNIVMGTKQPIVYYKHSYHVYCPICNHDFIGSDYLKTVFKDNQKALWLANMVTHHRHSHITWWNKCWGWHGGYYREASHFGNYDDEKKKVNEQAKRVIARKCADYLVLHGINEDVFSMLQNTEEKTLEVVKKVFKTHEMPAA